MQIYQDDITNVESLIKAIRFAYNKFNSQIWWRGQRDFSWLLEPSIYRSTHGYDERAGILRFQQKAISRHLNTPPITDRPGWLFLMQHYRLPTRLLDWSESPLIASFFASEIYECHNKHPECIEDTDGALYALSPYKLNHSQLETDCILMPEDTDSKAVMNPAFDVNAKEKKFVIAIRPSEVDVRLLVQLSVFTLNGFKIAIENLPPNDNYLIKFRIPKESKSQLRKNLKQLGIRLSSIFPDLDHLSEEIKELVFKPMKSNQTSQPVQQLYGNLRGKEPST